MLNRVKNIKIDKESCIGCKKCMNACFTDVFRYDEKEKKVIAAYPEECEWCLICEEQCPKQCIFIEPKIPVQIPEAF